jgi:UDP-N-acetylglucosamine 2-epimerase (non-hydrolysing)
VPSFDVPTVNLGLRQKGRLAAKSVLHCAATEDGILEAIELAVSRKYKQKNEEISNPYSNGDASSRVIDMIKSFKFSSMKVFHDLEV